MSDVYPIYTPSRPRSQRSRSKRTGRSRTLRIDTDRSLIAVCWVVGIPCGVAFLFLLMMWPRSYFRSDDLVIAPPEWNRGAAASNATPISLYGVLTFADPDRPKVEPGDRLRWAPVSLTSGQRASAAARGLTLSPTVNPNGRITIPYWTLVAGSGLCLALALGPVLAAGETSLPQFRIGDLMILTTLIAAAAAIGPMVIGRLGEGGGVLVAEVTLLLAATYGLVLVAAQSRGEARAMCSCLAGLFATQTIILSLFAWHCWERYGVAA